MEVMTISAEVLFYFAKTMCEILGGFIMVISCVNNIPILILSMITL